MATWWDAWKSKRQAEDHVEIELWDATRLRKLLLDPRADHVRRHHYHPYSTGQDLPDADPSLTPPARGAEASVSPPAVAEAPAGSPWQGGDVRGFGGDRYLAHDGVTVRHSADHAWRWQEATADQIGPRPGRVWLRQVRVLRDVPEAQQCRRGLRAQARLLASLEGVAGVPRLLDVHEEADATTVVTAQPVGATWREHYGPRDTPLDRITAAGALAAVGGKCSTCTACSIRTDRVVCCDTPHWEPRICERRKLGTQDRESRRRVCFGLEDAVLQGKLWSSGLVQQVMTLTSRR